MCEEQRMIYEEGKAELIEKKSRFLAEVYPISSEEDVTRRLEEINKKYWDARHHCFAYVIGERNEIQRCSDDGEPSGTAGKPILDVLMGNQIHNAMIVVTRYFGGTLLGTGGLVRAYSNSASAGLKASTIITKHKGMVLHLETDYSLVGKIQYLIGSHQLSILSSEYEAQVTMKVLVPVEKIEKIEKELMEVTSGQIKLEQQEELYFGHSGQELVLLS